MRILQLGRYDFAEIQGGVQFYADSLAQELRKSIVVDQLVSSIHPRTRVKMEEKGIKVLVACYGHFQSVPVSPGLLFWIWKLVLKNKYDLIHLNFPDPLGMLAAMFLPKKIPIVVTWHADVIRQKWALKFYLPVLKYFMKRVKRIFVATPYHLDSCPQLKELGLDQLVEIVPMGIDPKLWELSPQAVDEMEKIRKQFAGRFVLLAVGRHIYYKGFEYLLKAMEKLPNCHLILAGSGPLTRSYQQQIRESGINDRVSFPGLLTPVSLVAHYHACDLFCFPSVDKTEAYGYAQLEAMMCGKPVLSTRLNNGVNYLNLDQETGFVVAPKDSQAIVDAVLNIQSHPELTSKFGKQSKARALSEFTIEKMAKRVLAHFQNLAQS
jgi:glycosyltransferase involved in cell wall biosynthesis